MVFPLNGGDSALSVEELEDSIKGLVNQRNELRDKLRRLPGPNRRGGGGGGGGGRFSTVSGRGISNSRVKPVISFDSSGVIDNTSQSSSRTVDDGSTPGTGSSRKHRMSSMIDEGGRTSNGDFVSDDQPDIFGLGEFQQQQTPTTTRLPANLFEDELKVEKRPSLIQDKDTNLRKRNRNLFGSLMGHLKKAKETLEKEKETKQSGMQISQYQKIDVKLQLERVNLAELRRLDFREQKMKNVEEMRKIQSAIISKDHELLRIKLENHYNRMTNFIRTRSDPPIFWLPAVHNKRTRQLQSETCEQIQHKVKSLRDQFNERSLNDISVQHESIKQQHQPEQIAAV